MKRRALQHGERKEIYDVLLINSACNEKCRQLVKIALENDGKDNVTLTFAQIQPDEFPAPDALYPFKGADLGFSMAP